MKSNFPGINTFTNSQDFGNTLRDQILKHQLENEVGAELDVENQSNNIYLKLKAKSGKVLNGVNIPTTSGIPNISTEEEMDALLVIENVGNVYRFVGDTTEKYVRGNLYIIDVID